MRNGAKIGFPGVMVGIPGGFCLVLGAEGCFLFGFPEFVATFAFAKPNIYHYLSFLPCVFSPEKIDDCPAYGGFSARETRQNKYGRDMLFWFRPPKCRAFVVI